MGRVSAVFLASPTARRPTLPQAKLGELGEGHEFKRCRLDWERRKVLQQVLTVVLAVTAVGCASFALVRWIIHILKSCAVAESIAVAESKPLPTGFWTMEDGRLVDHEDPSEDDPNIMRIRNGLTWEWYDEKGNLIKIRRPEEQSRAERHFTAVENALQEHNPEEYKRRCRQKLSELSTKLH